MMNPQVKHYRNIRSEKFVERLKETILVPDWEIKYSGWLSVYWLTSPSAITFYLDCFPLPSRPKLTSRLSKKEILQISPLDLEIAKVAVVECWRGIYRKEKVEKADDGN